MEEQPLKLFKVTVYLEYVVAAKDLSGAYAATDRVNASETISGIAPDCDVQCSPITSKKDIPDGYEHPHACPYGTLRGEIIPCSKIAPDLY